MKLRPCSPDTYDYSNELVQDIWEVLEESNKKGLRYSKLCGKYNSLQIYTVYIN